MQEKHVEQALQKAVRQAGGHAYKFTSPGTNGMPDRLILLRGGKLGFVEVKAPGKKPRPLQARRLQQLQDMGFIATYIDHPDQIQSVINAIQTT